MFETFFVNQKIRVLQFGRVPDEKEIIVRPPDGKIWLVLDAQAYHNHGQTVSIYWEYMGEQLNYGKQSFSVAANKKVGLAQGTDTDDFPSTFFPPILDHDNYLTAHIDVLAAGKMLTVQMRVLEWGN